MTVKREFNGMSYRQLQRLNSNNKSKLKYEEVQLLKNGGYKNIGWDKVKDLYLRIEELLNAVYRNGWNLDELFLEANRIGNKYQSAEEIFIHNQELARIVANIDEEIDRHFPDNEIEIIGYK